MSEQAPPDPLPSARQRILQSAHDLFYRDGLRATGIDRVIAEAQVTKVTFYRHFPSKQALIGEFLAYRHARWIGWFSESLQRFQSAQSPLERQQHALAPVAAAMAEWFTDPLFRGCAFINAVAELGGGLAAATELAAEHKRDMVKAIEQLLHPHPAAAALAQAAGLAVDGAIVRAQLGGSAVTEALQGLNTVLAALERQ